MARSSLARGLAFALVAGALAPSCVRLSGPNGVGYFALFAVAVHLLVVAPELGRGLRAGALAVALALPCALLVHDPFVLVALAGVILALARSAVIYPRPFARALVAEVAFLSLGVLGALVWADLDAVGILFMTWSFWLVQSGFALLAPSAPPSDALPTDPFERAQRVAEAVLAGRPR